MKAFGGNWALNQDEFVSTPVGRTCAHCEERITEDDEGFIIPHFGVEGETELVQHRECFLRAITGSVGHILKQCRCYGGTMEDPPELSRREAAKAAVAMYRLVGGSSPVGA